MCETSYPTLDQDAVFSPNLDLKSIAVLNTNYYGIVTILDIIQQRDV